MKYIPVALLLVLAGIAHGVTWKFVPVGDAAMAWNVTGALFRALLLFVVGNAYGSRPVWLAVALLAGFELQTASCSLLFIVDPWPKAPGSELCSSKLHFPVGLVSVWAALMIVGVLREENHDE